MRNQLTVALGLILGLTSATYAMDITWVNVINPG